MVYNFSDDWREWPQTALNIATGYGQQALAQVHNTTIQARQNGFRLSERDRWKQPGVDGRLVQVDVDSNSWRVDDVGVQAIAAELLAQQARGYVEQTDNHIILNWSQGRGEAALPDNAPLWDGEWWR
jgi:hypothetical protein